jgi:hypothetical protein
VKSLGLCLPSDNSSYCGYVVKTFTWHSCGGILPTYLDNFSALYLTTLLISRIYIVDDTTINEYKAVGGRGNGILNLQVEETSYWHENILNKQSSKSDKGWYSNLSEANYRKYQTYYEILRKNERGDKPKQDIIREIPVGRYRYW